MGKKVYRVTWEIDVEAETPEDAAKEALSIQRDIDSEAVVFGVTDTDTALHKTVDLLALQVDEINSDFSSLIINTLT